MLEGEVTGMEGEGGGAHDDEECENTCVEALVRQRAEHRQSGDYKAADALRLRLHALGVTLDDRNGSFRRSAAHPTEESGNLFQNGNTLAWRDCAAASLFVSLEAYLAHSIAWDHVPKLQTYRELLGKRTEERHALATRLGERLGAEVAAIGTGAMVCVEKPYLEGFIRGFRASGSRAPFVLFAINGGDQPVSSAVQERLLTLDGLCACYAHNLHLPPSAAAAARMRPLPLGALPIGVVTGDAILRDACARGLPWAERDPRLLVAPMRLNSRVRERYLEVLSDAAYAPLVRIVTGGRLPLPDFLALLASHRSTLSPPGRGHDCFRTWQALAVGTTPLVPCDDTFDARLNHAGPIVLPAPDDLTPAKLKTLLEALTPPDQRAVRMSHWVECWRKDLADPSAATTDLTDTDLATDRIASANLGIADLAAANAATHSDAAATTTPLPLRHAPTPTSPPLPTIIIGFSTGHVGTTSLSSRSMYACECEERARCRCALANYGFPHEQGGRQGLQTTHTTLREWHEAPLVGGATLAAREAELVNRAYLPRWRRHAHTLVLSHETLFLYKGLLAAVPIDALTFVRVRRARDEFVASFGKYDTIERDWYHLEPGDHESATSMPPEVWAALPMAERAGWFHDEVEARWQQLRRANPTLRVVELEWSKAHAGSFEAMAEALARVAGLRVSDDGVAHRKAGSRRSCQCHHSVHSCAPSAGLAKTVE